MTVTSPSPKLQASLFAILACLTLLATSAVSAQDQATPSVEMTINADKTIQQIDERIYSHFLEHIYNSCNGGLWGELVWNRSLEAGKDAGWVFEDGVLKQTTRATDCRFLLGVKEESESPWTDYDVRVLAKKVAGSEGFLVLFRAAPDMSSYYWLNLGGWENRFVAIEKQTPKSNGRHIVGGQKPIPPIEPGEIYDIRIVVTGQNIKVFVNQELVHEVFDPDENAPKSGCVGVGTWGTQAEFGQVLVRDLRRQKLFDLADADVAIKTPVDVRYWTVDGQAEKRRGDARNSDKYLRFTGEGSIEQGNFNLQGGEIYDYSFWTRGEGDVSFNVASQGEDVKAFAKVAVKNDDWFKVSGTLSLSDSKPNSTIRLGFAPKDGASLDVDQISLFPRSWRAKTGGYRPDLLEAIAALRPTMIRWPGGCYASAYRWKSGIGPQDDRVAYPLELWNDVDVNSFGIDEFIPFCRRVGAEPIMVVDVGTAQWVNAVGDPALKDVDWIQEVCDWVEYCNGSTETKWGAERAKNGHAEPYGVKYWEIDNEVRSSDTPSEKYVAILDELVPRMKKIDPSIKIIACGSWTGDKMRWDSDIVKGAAHEIDYLSLHRYDDPNRFAVAPYENEKFYADHREMIANSKNPELKLFSSEWNAQSTDWRTGLHAGGYLNGCERVSDVLAIAAPALFLRHQTATGWDNAFVNFDNNGWFPAPNYVVMQLWRNSYAPNLVELTSESAELKGDTPIINAVATKSEDGKTIYLKAVNNLATDVKFNVACNALEPNAKVEATVVSPELEENETARDKLAKRNDLDSPNRIEAKPLAVEIVDGKLTFVAPSYSAFVVKIVK